MSNIDKEKTLNKTKKCPKYYRRDEKTGICEYQEKKSFKLNSEGFLEIPEEFRELVTTDKGEDFFKQNYEIITDKEKKKGRVKGILFTSEKNKTRRKKSNNSNSNSQSILLENTPSNKSAAESPVPSLPMDNSPSKEIDIHIDGKPAILINEQKSIIVKPLPKKIRIKKSNKIIEIREPNIMDALRDAKDTNDAYINHLLDYDPAGEKEQPPENVPLEKNKQFHQIENAKKKN